MMLVFIVLQQQLVTPKFSCRFKSSSKPSGISKGAPDFCTVYVISKGKISSVRNASRPAPHASPLLSKLQNLNSQTDSQPDTPSSGNSISRGYFSTYYWIL